MREQEQEGKDDFWSARHYLFTAKFPTYYKQPQKVWGRFHTSEEQYSASKDEIIPLKEQKGKRTYVMMQPYVREPNLTVTIGLYDKPKQYADQESSIGDVIGSRYEGFREAQVGNAQAWYYSADKIIVLWECFFNERLFFLYSPPSLDLSYCSSMVVQNQGVTTPCRFDRMISTTVCETFGIGGKP